MPLRIQWDRNPVSVHSDDPEELQGLIIHLKHRHGIKKRSLIMEDREDGGYLFFIYQPCDPRWILEFQQRK